MTTEAATPSLTELLARHYARNVEILDAALDAIEKYREATRREDEAFAAWFRFERDENGKRKVHGNTVRAAERRANDASYRAIDAVSAAAKLDDRIGSAWGYDVTTDDVVEALKTVRAEEVAKLDRARNGST